VPVLRARKHGKKCQVEALVEMYLAGVSVRRVEDITEALWGTRVSSGTVSRLNQKIYRHIEAWRNREIVGGFPYVYLDGVILKRSRSGEIKNVSVLVAIGPDGHSALMLTAARLRHVASIQCGKRRYLSMDALLNPAKQEAAA
jgi:transposase-like protein